MDCGVGPAPKSRSFWPTNGQNFVEPSSIMGEEMSNVIQLLESMGANAAMARMSSIDFEAFIASVEMEDQTRKTLLARDQKGLSAMLDGRHKMFCMIFAPEEKESPDAPEREDKPSSPDDNPVEK